MKDQHGNKITEHEFTKDIGHRTEDLLMNTIKDNQELTNHKPIFMTTENWREEFEIVWQMSVDHISDNRAGCYGKMDMVKKEMGGFISTLLSKERNKVYAELSATLPHSKLIQDIRDEERNKVLEQVKTEVEKELEKWDESAAELEDGWGNYTVCLPWELKEKKVDISTIIENLKNNISQN